MFDTTYVDQLGKTISGEFYFGAMCRETRRRIAISTDTSKGKLRYSRPVITVGRLISSTIAIYSLFSKSDGIDEPDRPAILRPAGSLSRPQATFVTRLQPMRSPARAARQLPDQSTTLQVDSSSTDDSRLRGALPTRDFCTAK